MAQWNAKTVGLSLGGKFTNKLEQITLTEISRTKTKSKIVDSNTSGSCKGWTWTGITSPFGWAIPGPPALPSLGATHCEATPVQFQPSSSV